MSMTPTYRLELMVEGWRDIDTIYQSLKPDNIGVDIHMTISGNKLVIEIRSNSVESIRGTVNDIFRVLRAIEDLI